MVREKQGKIQSEPNDGQAPLVPREDEFFSSAATVLPDSSIGAPEVRSSSSQQAPASDDHQASLYELLDVVGEGGMGAVYRAQDKPLNRVVAVKVLHEKIADNEGMIRRFLKEAQITAQLEHPAIVPTYHIEKNSTGQVRLAMRLIDGETLESFIGHEAKRLGKSVENGRGLKDRLEFFLRAMGAVQYAHDKGVVHRDLKSENIMLGPFRDAYVMDWGLATLKGQDDSLLELSRKPGLRNSDVAVVDDPRSTRMGDVLGTVAYMAPEQAMGAHEFVTARSDQFAMALILLELVTLTPARTGKSFREVLALAMQGKREVTPPWVPAGLSAIVARGAAADPEQRYPSLREMDDDIRRFLRGEELSVLPDSIFIKFWRWVTKNRLSFTFALLFLLVSTLALITFDIIRETQRKAAAAQLAKEVAEEVSLVAGRAVVFDTFAKDIEYELAHLAGAIEHVLILPPGQQPQAVANGASVPLAEQPLSTLGYPSDISLRVPAIDRALKSAEAQLDVRRLALVQDDFKATWQRGLLESGKNNQPTSARYAAYVATPKGALLSYPAKVVSPELVESRHKGLLRTAPAGTQVHWNTGGSHSLVTGNFVSAQRAVYSEPKKLLGILGIDTRLSLWKGKLALPSLIGFEQAWLLDSDNQILASIQSKSAPQISSGEAIIEAVREEQKLSPTSGELEMKTQRVLYSEVPTLGWLYVVAKQID